MKKLLTFILLLIIVQLGYSQNPKRNLDKYWNYRARFLGEDGNGGFIKIGKEPGQSLPMSGRNPTADCNRDWHLKHHNCKTRKGNGKVEWGDGTMYLAHYIALLAMEYRNLKDANQNTKKTENELYYALEAFARLDKAGEEALGMKGELNGFFIRDDVPHNFHLDPSSPKKRTFYSDKYQYDCVQSSRSCEITDADDGSFMSQDQLIFLLMSFAFVKEMAPNMKMKNSRETAGERVEKYTNRIMTYIMKTNWKIVAPNGEKISNRWGGDLRAFNFLIAKSADRITEGKFKKSYQKGSSKRMGKMLASSFDWGFNAQNHRNHGMIFQMVIAADIWKPSKVAKRALKAEQVCYALSYAVLNDKKLDKKIKKEDLEAILNSAPWDGPCFGTPDCKAPDGWKSSDRWWHPNHKNGNKYGLHFEYTGIDYMFFYNLYHYLYKKQLPKYAKRK